MNDLKSFGIVTNIRGVRQIIAHTRRGTAPPCPSESCPAHYKEKGVPAKPERLQ